MSEGLGVVSIVKGPMGECLVMGGLSENGGKKDAIAEGAMLPVVGLDFPGGAQIGVETLRAVASRETKEEFLVEFPEERFRRAIPDMVWVRQLREGELWNFSVACFVLGVAADEVRVLINRGAVILKSRNDLRLRDWHIMGLVESVL